jgi:hypothetical protein
MSVTSCLFRWALLRKNSYESKVFVSIVPMLTIFGEVLGLYRY